MDFSLRSFLPPSSIFFSSLGVSKPLKLTSSSFSSSPSKTPCLCLAGSWGVPKGDSPHPQVLCRKQLEILLHRQVLLLEVVDPVQDIHLLLIPQNCSNSLLLPHLLLNLLSPSNLLNLHLFINHPTPISSTAPG